MTRPMMTALERLSQSNADKAAALMQFNPALDYSKMTVDRPLPRMTDAVDWAKLDPLVPGRMTSSPQFQELPRIHAAERSNLVQEFQWPEPIKPNAEFVKAPLQTSHSGYMYYDPAKVRGAAKRVAEALPLMMAQTGADTVVVLGKSGMSIAYAALMLIDFPLVTVRRPGEQPRGSGRQVEGPEGHVVRKYLILDDLVGSGGTANNIDGALQDAASSHSLPPECVGILCYDSRGADYHITVGRNRVPVKGTDEIH